MAESAANFTFTTQNRPSIFEVVAQKTLQDTLHPAVQKVANLLADTFPRKFWWLGRHYDETFLILDALLQYGYLNNYDATFSENFYGLKRVLRSNGSLDFEHRKLSLAICVLLPYLKRKFDEEITQYRFEQADGSLRDNFEGRKKKLLIFIHSSFEVTWKLVTVYNFIKYMAGSVDHQLPILRLLGLKFVYADPESESISLWTRLIRMDFSGLSKIGLLKQVLICSFESTAFFLQFLQVWNAEKSNYSINSLPKVDPPPLHNKAKYYKGKCPICLQRWKIPTVLPVSGYTFCFPCILRYLRENQKCPVTNLPAKPLDIIRLFDAEYEHQRT